MKKIIIKRTMSHDHAQSLKGKFIEKKHWQTLIDYDCDGYDVNGKMLFRYRKKSIPMNILKSGFNAFKGSIELTDGRGITSGSSHKRIRKDGSVSNITVGNKVLSGNVGYMDAGAMVKYCRKTAFARKHFEKYQDGIPFVKFIDKKYAELCPAHYKKQISIANGTNKNYRISDTSFTTVTVNKNFRTAIHKDSGDLPDGFGNLIVYREGHYDGGYFCLPEFGVAIDMQNEDILFVDVHRFHGNSEIFNCSDDYLRISFVMYYREYMYKCKQPSEELQSLKINKNGFFKL